jgi:ABC-type dipeptide/oligopeptide/nickel transport system permease component
MNWAAISLIVLAVSLIVNAVLIYVLLTLSADLLNAFLDPRLRVA